MKRKSRKERIPVLKRIEIIIPHDKLADAHNVLKDANVGGGQLMVVVYSKIMSCSTALNVAVGFRDKVLRRVESRYWILDRPNNKAAEIAFNIINDAVLVMKKQYNVWVILTVSQDYIKVSGINADHTRKKACIYNTA
jgi:hypothetical protein